MTKAMVIHETGGPEVMRWEDFDPGRPGPGQVRVEQKAAGLNFIDVYFRTGLYKSPKMPFVPGSEGAGTVSDVGEGVTRFKVGDRIAYSSGLGTYAQATLVEAERAVLLPPEIAEEIGAALMLKGMTTEYLLNRTYPVRPGTVMLFHAAAGGVGQLAGPWAKHLGATVIGTAGSAEKCKRALESGYDHVINYREEDFLARVLEITDGGKCDVVYDSIGRDTFPKSLDCLKLRGTWVSFGQSSGKLPDIDLAILNQKGSLFVTRPSLFSYISTRAELEQSSGALFDVIAKGIVPARIDQKYRLERASDAHRDLEGRKTTGATVLTM